MHSEEYSAGLCFQKKKKTKQKQKQIKNKERQFQKKKKKNTMLGTSVQRRQEESAKKTAREQKLVKDFNESFQSDIADYNARISDLMDAFARYPPSEEQIRKLKVINNQIGFVLSQQIIFGNPNPKIYNLWIEHAKNRRLVESGLDTKTDFGSWKALLQLQVPNQFTPISITSATPTPQQQNHSPNANDKVGSSTLITSDALNANDLLEQRKDRLEAISKSPPVLSTQHNAEIIQFLKMEFTELKTMNDYYDDMFQMRQKRLANIRQDLDLTKSATTHEEHIQMINIVNKVDQVRSRQNMERQEQQTQSANLRQKERDLNEIFLPTDRDPSLYGYAQQLKNDREYETLSQKFASNISACYQELDQMKILIDNLSLSVDEQSRLAPTDIAQLEALNAKIKDSKIAFLIAREEVYDAQDIMWLWLQSLQSWIDPILKNYYWDIEKYPTDKDERFPEYWDHALEISEDVATETEFCEIFITAWMERIHLLSMVDAAHKRFPVLRDEKQRPTWMSTVQAIKDVYANVVAQENKLQSIVTRLREIDKMRLTKQQSTQDFYYGGKFIATDLVPMIQPEGKGFDTQLKTLSHVLERIAAAKRDITSVRSDEQTLMVQGNETSLMAVINSRKMVKETYKVWTRIVQTLAPDFEKFKVQFSQTYNTNFLLVDVDPNVKNFAAEFQTRSPDEQYFNWFDFQPGYFGKLISMDPGLLLDYNYDQLPEYLAAWKAFYWADVNVLFTSCFVLKYQNEYIAHPTLTTYQRLLVAYQCYRVRVAEMKTVAERANDKQTHFQFQMIPDEQEMLDERLLTNLEIGYGFLNPLQDNVDLKEIQEQNKELVKNLDANKRVGAFPDVFRKLDPEDFGTAERLFEFANVISTIQELESDPFNSSERAKGTTDATTAMKIRELRHEHRTLRNTWTQDMSQLFQEQNKLRKWLEAKIDVVRDVDAYLELASRSNDAGVKGDIKHDHSGDYREMCLQLFSAEEKLFANMLDNFEQRYDIKKHLIQKSFLISENIASQKMEKELELAKAIYKHTLKTVRASPFASEIELDNFDFDETKISISESIVEKVKQNQDMTQYHEMRADLELLEELITGIRENDNLRTESWFSQGSFLNIGRAMRQKFRSLRKTIYSNMLVLQQIDAALTSQVPNRAFCDRLFVHGTVTHTICANELKCDALETSTNCDLLIHINGTTKCTQEEECKNIVDNCTDPIDCRHKLRLLPFQQPFKDVQPVLREEVTLENIAEFEAYVQKVKDKDANIATLAATLIEQVQKTDNVVTSSNSIGTYINGLLKDISNIDDRIAQPFEDDAAKAYHILLAFRRAWKNTVYQYASIVKNICGGDDKCLSEVGCTDKCYEDMFKK